MLGLLTLLTPLISAGPGRDLDCYDYSDDYSLSDCESFDWCRPRYYRKNPRRHFYWLNKAGDKCSSSFKQVEFLLGTVEPADTAVVNEVFRNLIVKNDSAVDEAYVNSKIEFESSKDDLYKNIMNCINNGLREHSGENLEYLNSQLFDAQDELASAINASNTQIASQIVQLGQQTDAEVLSAIRTQNSPFQLTLSTVVLGIADTHKTILTGIRNDAKRAEPSLLSSRKQRIDECINEAFKTFNNSLSAKWRLVFENLKKKLETVAKSSETTLVNGLNGVNRRIVDGIKYILNLCREALEGKSCGDTQVAIPFILPDSGANPILN